MAVECSALNRTSTSKSPRPHGHQEGGEEERRRGGGQKEQLEDGEESCEMPSSGGDMSAALTNS